MKHDEIHVGTLACPDRNIGDFHRPIAMRDYV